MGNREVAIFAMVAITLSVGLIPDSFAITSEEIKEMLKIDDHTTKPTFGLSHENQRKMVDYGFSFNNKTFAITDNFHTPFPEQSVTIGEMNSFEAKVFAEHGLKVQEFIFGIPQRGEAHLGDIAIEIWYDSFGEIQDVKAVQKSNVIDIETLEASHQKTNCTSSDSDSGCDITRISMVFLEPLENKVMAIKAIDNLNRYQITYLNDGFDISGDSLNPMSSVMIMSPVRNEGLIKVTQEDKFSTNWITEDGRIFERNDHGSFKQINHKFERFQDSGEPRSRLHSGFTDLMKTEQDRASQIFDASKLISELPPSQSTPYVEIKERITTKLKAKMLEIEKECLEYLQESDIQARW